MIKSAVLLGAILLQGTIIKAQETLYNYIELGNYQVGYMDTLLFDTNYRYQAYNYAGDKPHFIQIWHPMLEKPKKSTYLTFGDFFESGKDNHLSTIYKELKKNYHETVIRDCIEENLITGDANDFGTFTYSDIVDLIEKTATKSILKKNIKHSEYPVIIYHHGSQSFPFENYAMAEYFASRGFIFVSANFHLPYENTIFGLKPYSKIIKDEEEQSLKSALRLAQTLSNSTDIFFIGHSWGAQMGLRTFDRDTTIKGFISLETTIEFKADFERIKEMWPEVYQKIITDNAEYPFPILFCAATGQEKPFNFFKNINAKHITFAPTKEEFEHNAYTSIFYLRYFLNDQLKQTDKEILVDRLQLYVKHLDFINKFIEGIDQNGDIKSTETIFIK